MVFSNIIQQFNLIIWLQQQPFLKLQLFSILSLIFLYKLLSNFLTKTTPKFKNLPPSPPKLPILGNLHQLNFHPHRALYSMSCKYGDLMLIHLGSVPTLIVSSSKAAREIMITHDLAFSNRPMTKKSKKLLQNFKSVVASPYGEHWRQMKSLCVLHLLNKKNISSFRNVKEQETSLFVEKIRKAKSSPINLTDLFLEFVDDLVCMAVFGRKYSEKVDGFRFSKLTKEILEMLVSFNFGDFMPKLGWIDAISGWNLKADKVGEKMDKLLEKVINERNGKNNEGKMKGFVDVLLQIQKDPNARFPLERESIKALMSDMFFGGTDTTYTLLEWVMTELLRHPQIMQQVQEEVRKIIRQKLHVEEGDLEEMKHLKSVIKETLRLHPPVPLLPARESTQDTIINGYDVPAKTVVLINAWGIQRDPAVWDEPNEFKPERFLNSTIDFRGQDMELIPFGAGRRMCPGISFAMASTELLLANLLHKFDWSLPNNGEGETNLDMSECFEMILHRSTPLFAIATPHIHAQHGK